MLLPCLIPVSVVVCVVSDPIGASRLISLAFYLNYGLSNERLVPQPARYTRDSCFCRNTRGRRRVETGWGSLSTNKRRPYALGLPHLLHIGTCPLLIDA
jgi:hypothetical protein